MSESKKELLVSENDYLTAGVHIGTKQKSEDMRKFAFKVRNDGLWVLNVEETDKRIRMAAKFLAGFEPERILVVAARQYAQKPARKFAEMVGANVIPGRLTPGILTNPVVPDYTEPGVIVVTDPSADRQALREAVKVGIPVVGLCDANNETKYVDLIIPTNNKGRGALALVYMLLAREVLKAKGDISSDSDFPLSKEDFESAI